MLSAQIKSDRHLTYADYLKFPEGERWEIIDGVAYAMTPAPAERHQSLVTELAAQVALQLRGKLCRVYVAPIDVRFECSNRTVQVVQPDIVVVCERSKIVDAGIVGAPDWVVEVLSPSSSGRDQILKRGLYEREGVPEYWLVHPVDRLLTVYRLGSGGKYGAPDIFEMQGKSVVQSVAGIEVDWDLWQPLSAEDEA